MASNRVTHQCQGFKVNEFVVYPSHGVGQIIAIEKQEVAGYKLRLFVLRFDQDKLTLRIPTSKVQSLGMRKLSSEKEIKKSFKTIQGRARIKRVMWSRRAQEYEAKINSGNLVCISEVVRDLFRSENQPEQSYSERQLYELALGRIAREIATISKISETEAVGLIEQNLSRKPNLGEKSVSTDQHVEAA